MKKHKKHRKLSEEAEDLIIFAFIFLVLLAVAIPAFISIANEPVEAQEPYGYIEVSPSETDTTI